MFFWCRGWIGPHTLYPLKALIPISTICKACVEIRFSLYSQRPKAVRCQKAASWQWLYQTGQIFSRSEGRDIFFGWQQEYTKEPTCFLVASPPLAHPPPPQTPPTLFSFTSLSTAVWTAPMSHLVRRQYFHMQCRFTNKNKIIWDEFSTGDQTIILGLQIVLDHRSSKNIYQKLWWLPPPPLPRRATLLSVFLSFHLSIFRSFCLFVFQSLCLCLCSSLFIVVHLWSSKFFKVI